MKAVLAVVLSFVAIAAAAQASQKVIKDPAEYNTYMAALNETSPAQKAAGMEDFVQRYPNSVVYLDALEQAMGAYQQAGNAAKVEEVAQHILTLDHDNVRALGIVVYLRRARLAGGATPSDITELRTLAEKGVAGLATWQKPEGASDDEFARMKDQLTVIFYGSLGFAELQQKDYAAARPNYKRSLAADPSNIQDIYQLAVADLQSSPLEVEGFWYAAKAIDLATKQNNAAAVNSITAYAKAKYKRYSGGEEGWPQLLATVAGQSAPPSGFTVKAAPTEAELAVQAVKENDPNTLSFSDWEFVLAQRDASPANHDAADKVWNAIQSKQAGARLALPVQVIGWSGDIMLAAITDDNQAAKKADIKITFAKMPTARPAVGAKITVVGTLTDYQPSPFVFLMTAHEVQP